MPSTSSTPLPEQGGFNERLKDALSILYNAAWVEGSNYKENNPEGSQIPSERETKKIDATTNRIRTLVLEEIIGEARAEHSYRCGIGCPHEPEVDVYRCTCGLVGSPRAEQRKKLEVK